MIQCETQKVDQKKKMKRASGTCGNKRQNILITEVLEGEDEKGMANKVIKASKIWQKIKHTDSSILANSINFKKYTSRHTIHKLVKTRQRKNHGKKGIKRKDSLTIEIHSK